MGMKTTMMAQFAKPSGWLGRLVGWLMAVKNRARLRWGIEQLDHGAEQAVLEIGFGPGSFIEMLLKQHGHRAAIAGIDISTVMLAQASRRNRAAIQSGQLQLRQATVEAIPFPDASFDRVFTSNTNMFWADPMQGMREIRRVLKPDGLFCLTLQPYWARDEAGVRAEAARIAAQMEAAGLCDIRQGFKQMRPISCLALTARKG